VSGGAFDYAFVHADDFVAEMQRRLAGCGDDGAADELRTEYIKSLSPMTLQLLRDTQLDAQILAKKMKAIEWLFSGDTSEEGFKREMAEAELTRFDEGYLTWNNS